MVGGVRAVAARSGRVDKGLGLPFGPGVASFLVKTSSADEKN